MPIYDATIDMSSNNSHTLMIELVGGGKRVLDVGCATGYLAAALAERGCSVSGVEGDPEAAEQARPHLEQLIVGDLATLDLDAELDGARFDVVVLGDVLEHLVDPQSLLRRCTQLLAPGGSVVISMPHVGHGSVRLALLQGRWEYRDRGLLDRTHLRFVTRRSLLDMVHESGLTVVDMRETTVDPLAAEVEVDTEALPPGVVDWVRAQPDAYTYQFVLRAVRDDARGAAESVAVERQALRRRVEQLEDTVRSLEAERDEAVSSVRQLESTMTLRFLAPARRLWGRRRRRIGGTT